MGKIPQFRFFFPSDSSLCRVDKKLISIKVESSAQEVGIFTFTTNYPHQTASHLVQREQRRQ